MTKKPSAGKAPITGRSARERAKAKLVNAAGRERAEKDRQKAIATRSRVVVGETAAALAPKHRTVRQLIAAAIIGSSQPDVRAHLQELSGDEAGLGSRPDFLQTWEKWQSLRGLERKIEAAWANIELVLNEAADPPDAVMDELFFVIEGLTARWEELIGVEHPAGQLMRMTSGHHP